MFLSEGKHLLMFNVQLCLTFERVSVMLKFLSLPLCRRELLWITACTNTMRNDASIANSSAV